MSFEAGGYHIGIECLLAVARWDDELAVWLKNAECDAD
jgi:hypothetical protein